MVVAVISVDTYCFLSFLDLTCHLQEKQRCFLVALCHLVVRRPNLQLATKKLLHKQVKILG